MLTMELCDIHKVEYTSDTSKFISLEGVQSFKGKICTVLGKKFILALIENSIELVIIDDCYSSADDQWNFFVSMKNPELICNFIYGSDSKPYLLKDLDDGTEVNFDALRYENSGNYLAFIVWIAPKCPSIIVEPLANSHILYRQHLGVSVKILYMFKDSGNLCFESEGTSIYVQFFKDVTVIKVNELIDIEWNIDFFLQNFSKFVANIYEFQNNSNNEEPKFICTHLWLNGDALIYSESYFNYNTLYNFDSNGALLNSFKCLGVIKYCYQRAIISTSNTSFNIDITINNNQEFSFSCPLNNCLNNKLKPLLDKNNMANVQVHIKQVCLEQQRYSLYLVLNKDEKSFKSEIILKTFGEHVTLQEASNHGDVFMKSGICKDINPSLEGSLVDDDKSSVTTSELNYFSSNFNEKNTNFSIQKSDSSISNAKSDMKSCKLDLIINNSNEPLLSQIKCSMSDNGLSKKSSISTLNVLKPKTEVHILKTSDNQCLSHSKKPGYKSTSNKHGDKFLQRQCLFEKSKIIDASNVELWKDYFKNETPQISEATEVSKSRNATYQTATEFFNSIIRPLAQFDELKSCHYFDNSLKHNPLMNIVGTPSIPLALLNSNGSMFALKEKVLILTSIFNKNALIATKCIKKSIFNYSNYRIPLLLWRDGKPSPLTEFIEGCPVQFDAVMAPDENYYQPLLIWTGTKPNHIPFLKMNASKTLMLSDIYDNVSVTQTASKSGEKQLEFIEGNEIKICRTFEKFKFKANKTKGQINKLIKFHNNEVISQYIFSLHSNYLELEFGQHYSIDESGEVFNIKELPNYGGLHLDVPVILKKYQGFCIIIFTIEDERISMSTKHPNLQELFHSSWTKREGIAHIFRQDIPRSFNVLLVSINDEVRSGFLNENQYTISNSSFANSDIRAPQTFFIFNVNDNHFQLIEIDLEVDPTFDPQEASHKYMTLPKLTFSPECKSFATSRGTSPANMVTAETEVLSAKKDIGRNACDTVRGSSAKKPKNISEMNSSKNIMQKLYHLLTTNNGKVSDNAMCYKSVFRNCSGTLYLKNKVSVIDIVIGNKHIEIFPMQEGFMQVDGRARKLLTVDKPASIKLDMFYDKESKRHKVTAIWTGKKSKTMIVSNKEQHFYDVVGQLLGYESRTVSLQCCIDGNFVNIVTYKSKRVFDENGTKLMDQLTIGCPVLVHLKKVITITKKVCWEILMMIELTDKITDHLFPTSVVNHGTHPLLYSATMTYKPNSRKLQINEISHIFKELTSKHFAIIFGKITSEELESIVIKGTYEGENYNFILKRNIFLDDPCELSICEICLIGIPQINNLIPFKILTGWYKRLLVNCCILVNYTHELIKDNIVKLKSGVDNNVIFAFMTKNVCILSNSRNKPSLYYLVQHCPPMKRLGLKITKMVLLCSDSWLLALTCMMTLSKEFDEKINELK